jgi:hypothetical protein
VGQADPIEASVAGRQLVNVDRLRDPDVELAAAAA